MTKLVDLIVNAKWLLPILPRNALLEKHAVVIHEGIILDICPQADTINKYQASESIDLPHHILMPGLINLHTHSAMNLLRGLADDLALKPWLEQHIWPAEKKLASKSFVYDGSLLACAEMLSGGVTTFNDMYFFPESTIEASLRMGMRANIGLVVLEFATNYASDVGGYLSKGTEVRDQYKLEQNITFDFAPHAPYTVGNSTFEKVVTLAEQLEIGIHTHLHETQNEISESVEHYGLNPLARLSNLGLLGTRLTLAHCVHLSDVDKQLLAVNGCHIAHCPSSNLKLASGIAPIADCIDKGINVGIGTDGAASNNRLDMFTEMRTAALIAKGVTGDATVVSANQVLEMATINGAKALGLEHKIGSVEVGKLADLVAVRMDDLMMQPCFDPVSHLVYVASRESVSHVWVNGDLKYYKSNNSNTGVYSEVEPQELTEIVNKWQSKMSAFKSIIN
jgi:5-methylthioadenosine/S-adenosylhomocysteine deaminase